jgi:hypothetical protein
MVAPREETAMATQIADGFEVVAASADCSGRNCPTIYRRDEDTYIVQGYAADGLFTEGLPAGEQAVIVPAALFDQLR